MREGERERESKRERERESESKRERERERERERKQENIPAPRLGVSHAAHLVVSGLFCSMHESHSQLPAGTANLANRLSLLVVVGFGDDDGTEEFKNQRVKNKINYHKSPQLLSACNVDGKHRRIIQLQHNFIKLGAVVLQHACPTLPAASRGSKLGHQTVTATGRLSCRDIQIITNNTPTKTIQHKKTQTN